MTNYPPPYPNQPPPGAPLWYPAPQADPLAASRRAAVAGWVIGGLVLLGGLCVGILAAAGPQAFMEAFERSSGETNVPAEAMRIGLIVIAVLLVIFSLTTIVLSIFVWRGSVGATITAIVLASISVILGVLNALTALPRMNSAANGAELTGMVCSGLVIPLVLIMHLAFLIQAVRAARQARQMQEQYRAQYWQYQQNQQAYGQGAYGAGQATPSSGPPPQAPPTRTANEDGPAAPR